MVTARGCRVEKRRFFALSRQRALLFSNSISSVTKQALNPRQIGAGGSLQLDEKMTPGDYLLQITVTDLLAGQKNSTQSQWMDFEIRR